MTPFARVLSQWCSVGVLVLTPAAQGARELQPEGRVPAVERAAVVEVPRFARPDLAKLPTATVLRVDSGDAVVVMLEGREVAARLAGIDAPALRTESALRSVGEPYAEQSLIFTTNLLAGEMIALDEQQDPEYSKTHSGRVFHIYRLPDGLLVNAELVRQGYARCDRAHPGRFGPELEALQDRAMLARKGLWGHSAKPAAPPTPEPVRPGAPVSRPSAPTAPLAIAPAATPAPTPSKAADEQSVSVYGTKSGSKYHRAGCSYLKSSVPMTLEQAKARGMSPCSRCTPPD